MKNVWQLLAETEEDDAADAAKETAARAKRDRARQERLAAIAASKAARGEKPDDDETGSKPGKAPKIDPSVSPLLKPAAAPTSGERPTHAVGAGLGQNTGAISKKEPEKADVPDWAVQKVPKSASTLAKMGISAKNYFGEPGGTKRPIKIGDTEFVGDREDFPASSVQRQMRSGGIKPKREPEEKEDIPAHRIQQIQQRAALARGETPQEPKPRYAGSVPGQTVTRAGQVDTKKFSYPDPVSGQLRRGKTDVQTKVPGHIWNGQEWVTPEQRKSELKAMSAIASPADRKADQEKAGEKWAELRSKSSGKGSKGSQNDSVVRSAWHALAEARFPDEKFWSKDGSAIHADPKGAPRGTVGTTSKDYGVKDNDRWIVAVWSEYGSLTAEGPVDASTGEEAALKIAKKINPGLRLDGEPSVRKDGSTVVDVPGYSLVAFVPKNDARKAFIGGSTGDTEPCVSYTRDQSWHEDIGDDGKSVFTDKKGASWKEVTLPTVKESVMNRSVWDALNEDFGDDEEPTTPDARRMSPPPVPPRRGATPPPIPLKKLTGPAQVPAGSSMRSVNRGGAPKFGSIPGKGAYLPGTDSPADPARPGAGIGKKQARATTPSMPPKSPMSQRLATPDQRRMDPTTHSRFDNSVGLDDDQSNWNEKVESLRRVLSMEAVDLMGDEDHDRVHNTWDLAHDQFSDEQD